MVFLIIFLVLLGDVAWWVWADRKVGRARHPRLWRTVVGVWSGLLLGYLIWFILFRTAARHAHLWMPIPVLAVIYLWHLLILPATVVYILLETSVLQARRLLKKPAVAEPAPASAITRRQMLGAALVAAPPLLTFASVGIALHRVHQFRIRRMELALPQLPPDLDGLTIAHVSDLHVGRFTRAAALPKIADAVNGLKADLVLFAGDLIDLSLSDLPSGVDFLNKLDPRHGLFVCEGNHDLFEDRDGFEIGVRKAGFPLLLNEGIVTSVRGTQLQVLGTAWRGGDEGIAGTMSEIERYRRPDLFQILLAHHPHAFDPAAASGIPLTISGHTHGGQIMLTEHFGAGSMMFRYWSGLYRKPDAALVVSNGVGNWFPLRVNAPAEIIHLTLRSGGTA